MDKRNRVGSAIGTEVVTQKHGDRVVFRTYLVERPTPTDGLRAAEAALDISFRVRRPLRRVWNVYKDFNRWMGRFGYAWRSLPFDNENNYVHLSNVGSSNDLSYGSDGSTNVYVIRKVIPEKLIYFDSLPYRLIGKDASLTGHNVMSFQEEGGETEISIFMEHTWYSSSMSIEELLAEARQAMCKDAVAFWRDYFVPDLLAAIETGGEPA